MENEIKKKRGAPIGNTNRKGKFKQDRLDDQLTIRLKSDIKQKIIDNAKALNLTTTEHIIRSTTGKRWKNIQ